MPDEQELNQITIAESPRLLRSSSIASRDDADTSEAESAFVPVPPTSADLREAQSRFGRPSRDDAETSEAQSAFVPVPPTSADLREVDEDEEDEADQQDEPLSDLKELILADPERALERTAQVEAGLVKLQAQKLEAESFVSGIDTVFQGLERGDKDAISQFEKVLYDNTGLTFKTLADMQAGDSSGFENAKLANLERKLEALENERAASKWIAEVGSVVASQVARETGLEFSPEQLWMARPHLQRGATVEDVRKAVMRVDPDAYDRAVAKRDGTKSPVPRSATLPTGKGGTHKTFEHTAQGFLKAYEAKRARGG